MRARAGAWRATAGALAAGLLLVAASGAAVADAGGASVDFQVRALAPGVFVHFGRPLALDAPGHDDIANIGFIIGTRCVAVVDSGGSTRIGRALRASIDRQTRLPVCYVINTHVHVDHVLGNAAFLADHPHFVGHAALPAALQRSRDLFVRDYAGDLDAPASADQIIGPDTVVAERLELDLGGRRLQLRAWPKAHTDCDLTVFDSASRTLFTGDLLFRERLPALDGDLHGWLEAIAQLRQQSARWTVPGHGPPTQQLVAALEPERRFLTALLNGVRTELSQGASMQQAIAQVADAERAHWLLWDSTHPRNVARAYEQLEWE